MKKTCEKNCIYFGDLRCDEDKSPNDCDRFQQEPKAEAVNCDVAACGSDTPECIECQKANSKKTK